jgi:ABC-type multidrug transport system fused ATPase/permease subunit
VIGAVRRKGEMPSRRQPREGYGLLKAVWRQFMNHKVWGLVCGLLFTVSAVLGPHGIFGGYLWGQIVTAVEAGAPTRLLLTVFTVSLILSPVIIAVAQRYYALWWIQQNLRVRLNVMRAQTGQRRLPATPPGEVVARAMDSDRIIMYADQWFDLVIGLVMAPFIVLASGSWIALAALLGIMALSAIAAVVGRPIAGRSAKLAADARAKFGRVLVSAVDAIRTVKLSARTGQVQSYLEKVDAQRIKASVFEQTVAGVLHSVPMVIVNLTVFVSWWLLYAGVWPVATALLVGSAAMGFQYIGWVSGGVITGYPGARAWQRATNAFADGQDLFALPAGVDLVKGKAPAPVPAASDHLEVLEVRD